MKYYLLIIAFWLTTLSYGQGGLILGPETKMTITDGKVNCTNLKMESGASLIENGNLIIGTGGSAEIKRNITGTGINPSSGTWHYVGSPTSSGTANTFLGGLLNWYDETTQKWVAVINPSTSLIVGQGYSVAMPATGDVVFTGGIPNYGDKIKAGLTSTSGPDPDYTGWHLLSNPYPSAIDWDSPSWTKTNIDAAVYVYDGQYLCWPYQSGYGTMPNSIIPAEQGFMVHVTGPGPGSITIPNAARVHNSQEFYKTSVSDLLGLEIQGNGYKDKMFIHFDENATSGFDPEYDAYKLFGIDEAPQLYSMNQGTKFTINVIPGSDQNPVIPVGLKVGANTAYSISASEIESFAAGTNIYLEDLQMNKTVKLNDEPVYTFNASKEDPEHRFNLLFNLVGLPEQSSADQAINIYSYDKTVYVNIPFEIKGDIQVYNLLGVKVASSPATGISLNRIQLNCSPGYYIVKVYGNNGNRTGKVFIN